MNSKVLYSRVDPDFTFRFTFDICAVHFSQTIKDPFFKYVFDSPYFNEKLHLRERFFVCTFPKRAAFSVLNFQFQL